MLGAYGLAFNKPFRKLYYNMAITAISVMVAALVGGIETLGLIENKFGLTGPFWGSLGTINEHFGVLGCVITGVFVSCWLISALIYRVVIRSPIGPECVGSDP